MITLYPEITRKRRMKKFLIFLLMAAAGYFAYEYLIKEKVVLEINADKIVSTSFSMDIEAPAISPSIYGSIQGTVKNISDEAVTNILLKYKLDGKPAESTIDRLEPGEQRNFSTPSVMIKSSAAPFYLEEMSYN
jgi:hypothetical protein